MSSSSAMLQSVEQLIAHANEPLHTASHKEEFQRQALGEVSTNAVDSMMTLDPHNPLLVKEEMEVQKDYFRKLKFTYLEQEAKRNFLYSITGDEPQGVQAGENEDLERANAITKNELKALKGEIEEMRLRSIEIAKRNTQKQPVLSAKMTETQALHKQIKEMELELQRIRANHPADERMTEDEAATRADQQIANLQELTDESTRADIELEVVQREIKRLGRENVRLGKDEEREEARAREVREGREAGDTRVDEVCHWLSTSIAFYKTLLGIKSVNVTSNTTLQIEYDINEGKVATLVLQYDEKTKRLENAQLLGSDLPYQDIMEAIDAAVRSNDVPGLVADLLSRLR